MDKPSREQQIVADRKKLRSQLIADVAISLIGVAFAVSGLVGGINQWRLGSGLVIVVFGGWAALGANRKIQEMGPPDLS